MEWKECEMRNDREDNENCQERKMRNRKEEKKVKIERNSTKWAKKLLNLRKNEVFSKKVR